MKTSTTVVLGWVLTTLFTAQHAFGEDLSQMCPEQPKQMTDDTAKKITAGVGKLGPLNVGQLELELTPVVNNLLQNIEKNDQVYLSQMIFATYCRVIVNSSKYSDDEKLERIKRFQQLKPSVDKTIEIETLKKNKTE